MPLLLSCDALDQESLASLRRFPGLGSYLPRVLRRPDDDLFRADLFTGDTGVQTRGLPARFQIPGGADERLPRPDDGGAGAMRQVPRTAIAPPQWRGESPFHLVTAL
jgi:hypothetical protein